MMTNLTYRSGMLILLLVAVLAACASQVVTTVPTSAPESTSVPESEAILTMEEFGFRFRYPAQYQAVIFEDSLCLTPAREYGMPGPCHVQNFGVEVLDAGGRTLEQAADEAATRGNPDIEIRRTQITVGGQPAILLDAIYAADILRMAVVVYNGRVYRLTFVPWVEDPAPDSSIGILYNMVIDSFEFLGTAPVPGSTPRPEHPAITPVTVIGTLPIGSARRTPLPG